MNGGRSREGKEEQYDMEVERMVPGSGNGPGTRMVKQRGKRRDDHNVEKS